MRHINKAAKLAFISTLCTLFFSSIIFAQDTVMGPAPMMVNTKTGAIKIEHLASLSEPWGMTWLPDGGLLVTEKPGRLRIYANGKLSEPIKGLPTIEYHGQGGLLDVEIDPDFAHNKYVYLYFTEKSATDPSPKPTRDNGDPRLGPYQDYEDATLKGGAVARGHLEEDQLKDVKIIWRQTPKTIGRGHFGGRLIFAPDGMLFITSGERQRFEPAQSLSSNLGKVIRIRPDGSIPADNPFVNNKMAKPDVWSLGHRNPLGAAINPATKQLWIHEMGPMHGDEINIPAKGKNYGWPKVSNGDNYDFSRIPDHETSSSYVKPIYYWHPAISPSGMAFYTASLFKDWNGNLLLGSFNMEGLIRLTLDGSRVKSEERIMLQRRVRDLIQASDGSIWIITDAKDGELIRLSPSSK
ncbi:MAG TPA: PQQ-dependent sugar dehydrogenase [Chitinophagaceae bacterium]